MWPGQSIPLGCTRRDKLGNFLGPSAQEPPCIRLIVSHTVFRFLAVAASLFSRSRPRPTSDDEPQFVTGRLILSLLDPSVLSYTGRRVLGFRRDPSLRGGGSGFRHQFVRRFLSCPGINGFKRRPVTMEYNNRCPFVCFNYFLIITSQARINTVVVLTGGLSLSAFLRL